MGPAVACMPVVSASPTHALPYNMYISIVVSTHTYCEVQNWPIKELTRMYLQKYYVLRLFWQC